MECIGLVDEKIMYRTINPQINMIIYFLLTELKRRGFSCLTLSKDACNLGKTKF